MAKHDDKSPLYPLRMSFNCDPVLFEENKEVVLIVNEVEETVSGSDDVPIVLIKELLVEDKLSVVVEVKRALGVS